MGSELAKIERRELQISRPAEVIAAATEEAKVLADVIERQGLAIKISGRKYVKVEGWTTLATLRGCLPSEASVKRDKEGRYIAVVELKRADGQVLCRASGECGGPSEKMWNDRPQYARRSMAVTRAMGKACRIAFGWVMALSGYETTPAEEMEGLGEEVHKEPPAKKYDKPVEKPAPATAPKENGASKELATESQKKRLADLAEHTYCPSDVSRYIKMSINKRISCAHATEMIAKAEKAIQAEQNKSDQINDPDPGEPPPAADEETRELFE